ncbi:MAG: phosphoribosylaminoimidazolesuccinocarboxamide synthase [Candidatus Kapabacteria bacterium]|jgi:phosphoribosylaminoimidazole-succinocarboxamide synthase|nr:phosphoribosylaminoimidazolesuccinocarboxamide synthase [Candidatus Kapabacteria bacterium]
MKGLIQTNFENLKLFKRGKVRDVYDLDDKLLIVATDRVSAFDYIMKEPIPNKGKILNKIAVFWFNKTRHIVQNHFITDDINEYPFICKQYKADLEDRSMLVQKTNPFPIECIVRGYITGSAWKEYQANGTCNGIKLPAGLREFEKLPEPLFTPSTKAETGHDENISFEQMREYVSLDDAEQLRDLSLALYNFAHNYLFERGLILADTKFEFGMDDYGEIILIDEALTPDSSRYWLKEKYQVGVPQLNFDKQVLRDYLLGTDWDRNSEPPSLPKEIINQTYERYKQAAEMIIGKDKLGF